MESVVFFGSGPVAAASLELLVKNFKVEAVITKPKPTHHRGNFPVIDLTTQLGLPTFTVSNKNELDQLMKTKPVQSKIGVLIDFGIIVSQEVIDYFPLGIVNSHFSLLPEWRGADPITFSILSGQKQTGVSLMLLVKAMDEGPLLAIGIQDISDKDTTPTLTDNLIRLSDALLRDTIPSYMTGTPHSKTNEIIKPRSQEEVCKMMSKKFAPTYSRKLTKQDGIIDWNKSAEQIEREIRAFADWPKSHTQLARKDVVLTEASVVDQSGTPGQLVIEEKNLIIFCGEKAVSITKLKPAGKNEMNAAAFIAGYGKLLKAND